MPLQSSRPVLLLYSTTDGHTRHIIEVMGEELTALGLSTDVRDLAESGVPAPGDYQAVLVGASIRYGKFRPVLADYAGQHAKTLNAMPTVFVAVNLTARKEDKRSPETNAYTRKFLEATPWQPGHTEVVAGALRYPRYRLFDRLMIQLIMKMTGGVTDASQEIDYTDWDAVRAFAKRWGEQLIHQH